MIEKPKTKMPKKEKGGGGDEDFGKGSKAKAQKAAAAADKESRVSAQREAEESAAWADGANSRAQKKQQEAASAAAERERKKKEIEDQLAREEAEMKGAKKLRGTDKVAARKAATAAEASDDRARLDAPTLVGSGIDAAIAAMTIVTNEGDASHEEMQAKVVTTSAVVGSGGILKEGDMHPEKRMKAAFKRFEERMLPELKEEFPTLRRSQINEMIFRKWQRSPENPINQKKLEEALGAGSK